LFASQIFCLFFFGAYQRLWQGSRLTDMSVYIKAVTAGTVVSMLILLFLYRFQSFSRAVFVIYWGLMLIFLLFSRFFFRLLDEWISIGNRNGIPVLIYGAGAGGRMLVREIEINGSLGLSIVGFIDDDPHKKGKKFYGYPVFGGMADVEKIINRFNVKEIIVSFKAGGEEKKKELHMLCTRAGFNVAVRQMKLVIA
jgi:UDP-GlcNAc:undecaprenyl-phosphate GlcNAc-1-phosphate transferase